MRIVIYNGSYDFIDIESWELPYKYKEIVMTQLPKRFNSPKEKESLFIGEYEIFCGEFFSNGLHVIAKMEEELVWKPKNVHAYSRYEEHFYATDVWSYLSSKVEFLKDAHRRGKITSELYNILGVGSYMEEPRLTMGESEKEVYEAFANNEIRRLLKGAEDGKWTLKPLIRHLEENPPKRGHRFPIKKPKFW